MSNTRQLMLAWHLYSVDNNDRLVNDFWYDPNAQEIQNHTYRNWVNNIMSWLPDEAVTNQIYLGLGPFAPYVQSLNLYKCPADHYLAPQQRARGVNSRTRSISMNGYMGPLEPGGNQPQNPFATGAYRQFLKLSEVPTPGQLFVTVDEHPDSINDGMCWNDANPNISVPWCDLPASYHNGAAGFSFADGHSEIHPWHNASTKRPIVYQNLSLTRKLRLHCGARPPRRWLGLHSGCGWEAATTWPGCSNRKIK